MQSELTSLLIKLFSFKEITYSFDSLMVYRVKLFAKNKNNCKFANFNYIPRHSAYTRFLFGFFYFFLLIILTFNVDFMVNFKTFKS